MIQPNELRIGNYVSSPAYPFIKVCGTNLETEEILPEFELLGQGDWWGLDNFAPIPLDADLLQKAGFELFPWGYVKKSSKDFGIRLNIKTFSYDVSGNNPVQIHYLHQLQNVYFSLTGEELTLNL